MAKVQRYSAVDFLVQNAIDVLSLAANVGYWSAVSVVTHEPNVAITGRIDMLP